MDSAEQRRPAPQTPHASIRSLVQPWVLRSPLIHSHTAPPPPSPPSPLDEMWSYGEVADSGMTILCLLCVSHWELAFFLVAHFLTMGPNAGSATHCKVCGAGGDNKSCSGTLQQDLGPTRA
ncbi:unnamed protein product [Pleuronectes platessa]|uniref:Uncharacterized protein n=1 Tax=Pleuronectes platessa TaxID=8262 RepID=A0A9N7TLX2_PLEPL|nr:unnamed protein product [Pleuronectes platessa]